MLTIEIHAENTRLSPTSPRDLNARVDDSPPTKRSNRPFFRFLRQLITTWIEQKTSANHHINGF